jgi:multimeric flavodoxin WrbA
MKYTCISAANIEPARNTSASVRACEMARSLILDEDSQAEVEIVALLDYEMRSCRMCGECQQPERCARDAAFNQVFEKMIAADAVFLVVPHYAPLPSKLMILCEKMEEIAFLNWCADHEYRFPLAGKPVGVVGHGGQQSTAEVIAYYQNALVEPVAQALRSVSMKVIGAGEKSPHGVAFGIQSIRQRPGSIFVDIGHDWLDIRERMAPLAREVVRAAGAAA